MSAEAEKEASNPSLAAYKAVEQWRQWSAARPWDQDNEDAVDIHILNTLERDNHWAGLR